VKLDIYQVDAFSQSPFGGNPAAAAWVLIHQLADAPEVLRFATRSGELRVTRNGDELAMDFPAKQPQPCEPRDGMLSALGIEQADVFSTDDYIVLLEDETQVAALTPDFARLKGLPKRGIAVTAKSARFDFISRWFGPNVGVNEDPVTGSAHTSLAPFWAERLGKNRLTAEQGGKRRGQLRCELKGDRVIISGHGVLYLQGTIYL